MPRTNLRNIEKLIAEATAAAVAKLQAERDSDADHIKEHAETSRITLDYLAEAERRMIDFCRGMFLELQNREQERLKTLQARLTDIITEEPALPEPVALKRINGGKS